ncbi:MAG: 2-oxoglutarate dehydrogenase E1 component [Limisphaerales bacterium]
MSELISSLAIHNVAYAGDLFSAWRRDATAVPDEWRHYFESLQNGEAKLNGAPAGPTFKPFSIFNPPGIRGGISTTAELAAQPGVRDRLVELIRNYRVRGHMIARIDPLDLPRPCPPELELEYYHFSKADLDRPIFCEAIESDEPLTIRQIFKRLRETYCRSIGAQFMHIHDMTARLWLRKRMEKTQNRLELSREEQLRIFTRLTDAVTFEEFIRKKFIGAKSFSLEGSEGLIPLLDMAIEKAGEQGVREIVLGMAHRGRLNVLANIVGKNPRQIFREFADLDAHLFTGRGDVKHHLGYSGDWQTAAGKKIHLSLCFNPSHLEFVNPVALGRTRAKQDRVGDSQHTTCLAVLVHGDAGMAGEGIMQETLNLASLPGYTVGGALHVVVNNQIGFTTSPGEGRSTDYATDVARMLQSPIFHVNGEDPEAVAQVVRLAMDFRREFKRDVFIDMYGYRRLGHNETDEPAFTQPVLYRAIEQRKSVREGYLEHLLAQKGITREEADEIDRRRRELLETELSEARSDKYKRSEENLRGIWKNKNYFGGLEKNAPDVETGVDQNRLAELLKAQMRLPEDFHPHPKIQKAIELRRAMAQGKHPLDWSAAESLAFASLATENCRIRLSGQDCGRGTFSQRHAILYDCEDGHSYVPLQHLAEKQAPVDIFNSPLSEAGVLGFDYGYSLDYPDGLILWEAQFGDFANAAQVIIDQFITSAEDKWQRLSGLVLLLPHGFEGQGPEHSSARLERFLALAAGDNIQVVYPTTPAQYFHLLRRQVLRHWRKPLVVMTPKSLLRHSEAVSRLEECATGKFQRVLPETQKIENPKRILLCAGKIFYELDAKRKELNRDDVAILRLEQLYPLPAEELRAALQNYSSNAPAIWVQEEPVNMGAWRYLRVNFGEKLFGQFPFSVVSRPESASPATGSTRSHKQEQQQLMERAFAELQPEISANHASEKRGANQK